MMADRKSSVTPCLLRHARRLRAARAEPRERMGDVHVAHAVAEGLLVDPHRPALASQQLAELGASLMASLNNASASA